MKQNWIIVITALLLAISSAKGQTAPIGAAVTGPEMVPPLRRVQIVLPTGYKQWDRDLQALSALATSAWRQTHHDRFAELGVIETDDKFGLTFGEAEATPLAKELEKLIAAPQMTADERLAKLAENRKQIEENWRERDVLLSLRQGEEKLSDQLMSEKMKQMELERQRIDMELFAKQSRRKALAAEIDSSKDHLKSQVKNDAVYEQLQKLVDLRESALKRMRDLPTNAVSASDFEKAEGDLAEAKVRAGERAEVIGQSADVDVIRKLTSELASLMVDVAELEARKSYIETQYPEIDKITPEQLKALTQSTRLPLKAGTRMPPIFYDLMKKDQDLLLERGKLLATKITIGEPLATHGGGPEGQ